VAATHGEWLRQGTVERMTAFMLQKGFDNKSLVLIGRPGVGSSAASLFKRRCQWDGSASSDDQTVVDGYGISSSHQGSTSADRYTTGS
jgi:hypothetical protein